MKFVDSDDSNRDLYAAFAAKVRAPLSLPFNYYSAMDGITVKRHLLIDDGAIPLVVGAVTTKVQDYCLAGETLRVAVAVYPNSLGTADPKYAMAGPLVFRKLLERHPLNILLGMGSPESSVTARLCKMLGWRLSPVPYLVMARHLAPLAAKQFASRPALAAAVRAAGRIGLFAPVEFAWRHRIPKPNSELRIENVGGFSAELDAWWQCYAREAGFSLVRNSRQLNAMFPAEVAAFQKLIFRQAGQIVGYAVLLVPQPQNVITQMGANVVTLVDFCVLEHHLPDAAAALALQLWRRNLDAVIVNHSHEPSVHALKLAGFRPRATNTYLAVSPALQKRLDDTGVTLAQMIITRADGDGPIGLGVEF